MRPRSRLLGALACAVLMGGTAVLAAWVGAAQGYTMHGPPTGTMLRLHQLAQALAAYHADQGGLPRDLADLAAWEGPARARGLPHTNSGLRDGVAPDDWGNPIRYAHGSDDFTLTSYGADGAPGGSGVATDLEISSLAAQYARPAHVTPPAQMAFGEFLAQPRAPAMLVWCAICAAVSGLLVFALTRPRSTGTAYARAITSWLATTAFAAFFTWIMAMLEIVKYH